MFLWIFHKNMLYFIAYGTWFVGNVADIWIVLGAPLLAYTLSREPSKGEKQ